MANNILKSIVVDANATAGNLLLLESKPYYSYNEGVKGKQAGICCIALSESMGFEKIEVKIADMLNLPFEHDGTPTPVEFDSLDCKLWQSWSERGAVKASFTATGVRLPKTRKSNE